MWDKYFLKKALGSFSSGVENDTLNKFFILLLLKKTYMYYTSVSIILSENVGIISKSFALFPQGRKKYN